MQKNMTRDSDGDGDGDGDGDRQKIKPKMVVLHLYIMRVCFKLPFSQQSNQVRYPTQINPP